MILWEKLLEFRHPNSEVVRVPQIFGLSAISNKFFSCDHPSYNTNMFQFYKGRNDVQSFHVTDHWPNLFCLDKWIIRLLETISFSGSDELLLSQSCLDVAPRSFPVPNLMLMMILCVRLMNLTVVISFWFECIYKCCLNVFVITIQSESWKWLSSRSWSRFSGMILILIIILVIRRMSGMINDAQVCQGEPSFLLLLWQTTPVWAMQGVHVKMAVMIWLYNDDADDYDDNGNGNDDDDNDNDDDVQVHSGVWSRGRYSEDGGKGWDQRGRRDHGLVIFIIIIIIIINIVIIAIVIAIAIINIIISIIGIAIIINIIAIIIIVIVIMIIMIIRSSITAQCWEPTRDGGV